MMNTYKKSPLRIAVVTETYPPEVNGVARTVHRAVQGLLNQGQHIDLFRPRQPGPTLISQGNLRQHLVPGISVPFYPEVRLGMPAYFSLKRKWKQNPPDVVHLITEGTLGLAGLLAARRLGIPIMSDYRTNYQQYASFYKVGFVRALADWYMRTFHNATRATLCPTREVRDDLAARGYKNLMVVGRGVDTSMFSPAHRSLELRKSWGLGRDGRAVLYVGRLAAEKNIDLAIEAFRAQQRIDSKLQMILVGDGPARARLEKSNPDLIFAGMQRGQELAEYYASGDIFLFPSLTETFGNVILEAMASKLAIVAYDTAAAHEKLHDGSSAALAPVERPDLFIQQAEELAEHRTRVRELRTQAFALSRKCSWDHVIGEMENLYQRFRPLAPAKIVEHTPAARPRIARDMARMAR